MEDKLKKLYSRIRTFWEDAEFLGPTNDLPIVCCLCKKAKADECKVPDFREFCPAFRDATELGKLGFVVLAPYSKEV